MIDPEPFFSRTTEGASRPGSSSRPPLSPVSAQAELERQQQIELVLEELRKHQLELRLQNEQLRAAESELVAACNRYADLYDFAPVGYVTVDAHGLILQTNFAAAQILGSTPEALKGYPLHGFFATESRSPFRQHLADVLESPTERTIDLELQRRDDSGGARAVFLRSIRPPDGVDEKHTLIALIDITERKLAEAKLQEMTKELESRVAERTAALTEKTARLARRERDLSAFFAGTMIGLMWVAPDGRVERVNDTKLQLLDRTSDAVLGHPVTEFYAAPQAIAEILRFVAQGGNSSDVHVTVTARDGTLRHLLIGANGQWEDGKLVRSWWFARDITERLQLEKEIMATADRERERIAEELHDDLCQHLAATEFMNETLACRLDAIDPESAKVARAISAKMRRSADLARELARGLSPLVQVDPEGMKDALRQLAKDTQRVFGVECEVKASADVIIADAEIASQLYRIVQEAVSNAVRHSHALRIEIEITFRDGIVVLGVHDNGRGFSPAPGARGLGLRIMEYRAASFGGVLTIERRPGGGTSIVCTARGIGRPADASAEAGEEMTPAQMGLPPPA